MGYDAYWLNGLWFFSKKERESNKRQRSSRGKGELEGLEDQALRGSRHHANASYADDTYSLSDIKETDIQMGSVVDNPTSTSMQSFASDFQGVDLPVFDDSQNNEPNSPNDIALGK